MKGLTFFFSRGNNQSYLLKLNHRCNYACAICGALENNKSKSFRELKEVKKELLSAKKSGYQSIDFAGSEPTLHPHLLEMVEYANDLGLRPAILTNGSRFASPEYAESFRQVKFLSFKINFHSHAEALFDEMSGRKGSYLKAIAAIKNIQQFRDLYPHHPDNFLSASVTVTGKNFRDLSKILEFLSGLKVKVVQFSPVLLAGNLYSHPKLLVETTRVLPYLKKALALAVKKKMHYYLCNFAVCLVESEREHLVPKLSLSKGFFKFPFCQECPYCKTCAGITKGHLISRYGRELLAAQTVFPKGFLEDFFNTQDWELINSLPIPKE